MICYSQIRHIRAITRGIIWGVFISLLGFTNLQVEQVIPKKKFDEKKSASRAIPAQMYNNELALIRKSINKANYISRRTGYLIQSSIQKASHDYRLPMILMHAIFKVESDYRYWIDHPKVRVVVHGKTISANAIGLGGVMWCFWGDSLKANHIAETKSDLYLPDVNVMASGYILRTLINEEAQNNPQLSKLNILNNVIRRYYGEYNKNYKMKMQKFTSVLWMKQVASILMEDISNKDRSQQFATLNISPKIADEESLVSRR
jgi:hypothetical protein